MSNDKRLLEAAGKLRKSISFAYISESAVFTFIKEWDEAQETEHNTATLDTAPAEGWGACPECRHEHYSGGYGPACPTCDCVATFAAPAEDDAAALVEVLEQIAGGFGDDLYHNLRYLDAARFAQKTLDERRGRARKALMQG